MQLPRIRIEKNLILNGAALESNMRLQLSKCSTGFECLIVEIMIICLVHFDLSFPSDKQLLEVLYIFLLSCFKLSSFHH